MVGYLKPEGTYPHLNIRAADDLCHFNDDGEVVYPEETEVGGDINPGYEVVDPDDLEREFEEESYSLNELMAMTDFSNEPDYAMTYDDYDYDYRESDWLYQGQEDYVELEESDKDETGLGRPTSGARYGRRLTGDEADAKMKRTDQNEGGHGRKLLWQEKAGGGKRGRESLRSLALVELQEPFNLEDHDKSLEAEIWFRDWQEEQEALAHIEEILSEFVDFDDQPVQQAA